MRALADEDLKRYATELELDGDAFAACLGSDEAQRAVAEDQADAQAVGVTGTPAFFINGRFLSGNQPYEAFKAIIDEELAELGK